MVRVGQVARAVLGIERAERLAGVNRKELCAAAAISENWATEIHKGMRLADYVTLRWRATRANPGGG